MAQKAAENGITPQELADRHSTQFKAMCERMNVEYDRFIRTTEPSHHAAVQDLWRRMEKAGDIYLGSYAGWYSVRDEAFMTNPRRLSALMVFGEAGREPRRMDGRENLLLFKLSAYQDRLLEVLCR